MCSKYANHARYTLTTSRNVQYAIFKQNCNPLYSSKGWSCTACFQVLATSGCKIKNHASQLNSAGWLAHKIFADLATHGFPKIKIQTHPLKPAKAKPNFRKVSLPPAKPHMLFPTHLWVREFGHKSSGVIWLHTVHCEGVCEHSVCVYAYTHVQLHGV